MYFIFTTKLIQVYILFKNSSSTKGEKIKSFLKKPCFLYILHSPKSPLLLVFVYASSNFHMYTTNTHPVMPSY